MPLSEGEIAEIFFRTGAHLRGHFALSSGLHSGDYLQCARVLQHPAEAERLCRHLAGPFQGNGIRAVVGPALGGILVSYEVARALGARAMYCERKDGSLVLRREFRIEPGERVLLAEDVVTTGTSVREVIAALPPGIEIAGCVALADRSGGAAGKDLRLGRFLAALCSRFPTYPPAGCPLCGEGRPLVKPGSRPGP